MKVEIEAGKCIASGQCVTLAPEVFDQDDDGVVILLRDTPDPADHEGVLDSVAVCPATAIHTRED